MFIALDIANGKTLNDYFWHYKAGEWIVQNKTIPTTGIFSWYALQENLYWFSHEWLSEVLLYITSFGKKEIAIIISGVLCAIFYFACMLVNKDKIEKNWFIFIVYYILIAIVSSCYFYPRPHMYSFILLFSELYLLYDFAKDPTSKKIYGLPIIAILWANIHGGSSNLIYILPIFLLITTLFNFQFERIEFKKIGKKYSIKLAAITLISTLSLMINPHGYKILLYPFENMADSFMMGIISEWSAPNIKTTSGLFFILPVVLCALLLVSSKKKIKAFDLLVFLFFTYMYFRSERFIMLFVIASVFYIFEYVPELSIDNIFKLPHCLKVIVLSFAPIFLFIISMNIVIQMFAYTSITINDEKISEDALEVIDELKGKKIYNHYNVGGELIYYGIDVFIDGRADMYSGYNFKDFSRLSTYAVNDGDTTIVEDLIKKYEFEAFVCIPTDKIMIYLENNPDKYVKVYEDETVIIYVEKNAAIISQVLEHTLANQRIMGKLKLTN